MRIKEYFYREVKEEQDLIQAEEESSGAAPRSADYMHQDSCERYGETLVRLSLHFDLALSGS